MSAMLLLVYFIFAVCIFFTIHVVWSLTGERISNLEMSCFALLALLWPLELSILFVVFMLIGPLIYTFRYIRRAAT